MGLSHHERIQKIIWSTHHITEAAKQITPQDYQTDLQDFKKLCLELWGELFSIYANNTFWLFGSDTTVQMNSTSIWGIAVYNQIKMYDIERHQFNSVLEDYLQINDILPGSFSHVYTIYTHVQNIQYAINRYNNDLSKQYAPFLKVCGKIYGELFNLFQQYQEFTRAYLIYKIAELLYVNTWESNKSTWDKVTTYLVETNAHHNLRKNHSIELLKECYKQLVKNKSSKTRMLVYLRLSQLKHEHEWVNVFKVAKKEKWGIKPLYWLKNKLQKQETYNLYSTKDSSDFYLNDLLE